MPAVNTAQNVAIVQQGRPVLIVENASRTQHVGCVSQPRGRSPIGPLGFECLDECGLLRGSVMPPADVKPKLLTRTASLRILPLPSSSMPKAFGTPADRASKRLTRTGAVRPSRP